MSPATAIPFASQLSRWKVVSVMAQHVDVVLVDDIDGSPADETVTFAVDGISCEIDLTSSNADRLREGLSEWLQNARRVSGARKRGNRATTKQSSVGASNSTIREWARANGHEVSVRGRVKAEVVEALNAANG